MNYYYLSFWTPIGYGGLYYRGEQHPLHPEAMQVRKETIARQMSIRTGETIPVDSVVFIAIEKLPEEVVRFKWPEDFKDG